MKTWIIYFVMISFCILSGCQGKSFYTSNASEGALENEEAVEVSTGNKLPDNEERIQNEPSVYPVVVTLIDPRTLEIVKSISPQLLGYGTDSDLYEANIRKIAKELARGTQARAGYDQSMVLDKIGEDGEIINGNSGSLLKESELVEKILAASQKGDHVFLPLYLLESNYQAEEVSSLNEVTVASFTTYFNSSESGRSENIRLSANALHNTLVGDGDYFSFNIMVGERTVEKGYQPAPEIINKELVMGIGGGICQTSSTLFNAVDQLRIRITERHHHSLNIGYVPTGRDATVAYGSLDFKFQNTSGAPFLIKSIFKDNKLTIAITTSQHYMESLER
ncbi:VanW family protein [Solibacillus silvestris]|uniref:VanW family protein n=1 Tax=Solibacillus silvestris TaxID=76853 RepID=UPI003F7F4693